MASWQRIQLNSEVSSLTMNTTSGAVTGSDQDGATSYDYVLLSPSLWASQQILNNTAVKYASNDRVVQSVKKILSTVGQLKIAPPYKVLRVWFDQQLDSSRPEILETPAHHPINLIAQFHLLEDEYRDWAAETGGSVIEFHLYTWTFGEVADADVWMRISPTVKMIYPEILDRNFKILGFHVNTLHNFPSSAAGLAHLKPTVDYPTMCGIPNLFFAGDWLNTSFPSALMEKAVTTGRLAANQILLNDHVKQASLTVPPSKGPGIL